MAITEEQRHRMYLALERELGSDEAAILMEHLPPVGWADVATKRDLDHLSVTLRSEIEHVRSDLEQVELRMGLKFEAVDNKIDGAIERLRGDVSRDLRSHLLGLIAANTTLAALVIAALRF